MVSSASPFYLVVFGRYIIQKHGSGCHLWEVLNRDLILINRWIDVPGHLLSFHFNPFIAQSPLETKETTDGQLAVLSWPSLHKNQKGGQMEHNWFSDHPSLDNDTTYTTSLGASNRPPVPPRGCCTIKTNKTIRLGDVYPC